MTLTARIKRLSVQQKLLYGYLLTFLVVIVFGNMFLYIYVRATIEDNIQSELKNSTSTILNMIHAAVNASISNHLRATAEKNLEIVSDLYARYKAGEYTEADAKALAATIFGSQTIGKTGYIYCVDSRGVIQVHVNPKLIGVNLSKYDFIHDQKLRRNGYLEYEWANPGEKKTRPKALYMIYFGPWDWIISASSYRDEFNSLIKASDLKESILSIKFGLTGYPFVMDSKGNLIIHPKLEGTNIYNAQDSDGHKFIQEVCRLKNGSIIYPWKNPEEPAPRKKLVFFNYIPELDWIVASSSYLEEFYRPLKTVTYLTLISVLLMMVIVLPLTWLISSSITKPINEMISGLDSVAKGDFSRRLTHINGDELGQLASYFNASMDQLEKSNSLLHESEKKFRSIFENSVEGIFQLDVDGTIRSANPSFATMTGFNSILSLMNANVNFQADLLAQRAQWKMLLNMLHQDKTVKNFQIQLKQQSQTVIWCLLNAKAIYDESSGRIIRIEGFVTDVNALKMAQHAQKEILGELEKRVEERTAELSEWISQLEQRDMENKLMHEMGDMLQACRTINETFPVIEQYLHSFFSEETCSLYLFEDSRRVLDRFIPTMTSDDSFTSFSPEACWALRQGKPYLFNPHQKTLMCDHVQSPDFRTHGYLCIPFVAHGVTTGLLHIGLTSSLKEQSLQDKQPEPPERTEESMQRKLRLSVILAEHLSLALANLKLREELEKLSLKDSLTGLSNRRHMEEILKRQFFRLKRHDVPFSILMIDVDHFKSVNDNYGHETGDDVLRALGAYLNRHSRGEDLSCRFGGEEFLIILAATDLKQAQQRAAILCKEISEQIVITLKKDTFNITVSIGVATSPEHGDSSENLLKSADKALYKAKKNGRNRVEIPG